MRRGLGLVSSAIEISFKIKLSRELPIDPDNLARQIIFLRDIGMFDDHLRELRPSVDHRAWIVKRPDKLREIGKPFAKLRLGGVRAARESLRVKSVRIGSEIELAVVPVIGRSAQQRAFRDR